MSKETERAEDERLIGNFLGGDSLAFDQLVLKYQKKVVNLCYRLMGEYDEAVDCAQETFVKVYRSLEHFRFQSNFSTWLFRITVNTCKNRLTSLKYRFHRRMIRLDGDGRLGRDVHLGRNAENPGSIEIANGSASPTAALEKKEIKELLQRAIDSLPKTQRTALVLRDVESLSYEEIGRILGLSLGTVKSRIARAREQLKSILRGIL